MTTANSDQFAVIVYAEHPHLNYDRSNRVHKMMPQLKTHFDAFCLTNSQLLSSRLFRFLQPDRKLGAVLLLPRAHCHHQLATKRHCLRHDRFLLCGVWARGLGLCAVPRGVVLPRGVHRLSARARRYTFLHY